MMKSEQQSNAAERTRFPLLALAGLALLAGIATGLTRVGWSLPTPRPELGALHGPLMVSGFLGTLIALERAVALARRWAYAAPALAGLGTAALLLGAARAGLWLLALASLVFLAASLAIVRRQRMLFTVMMTLGASAWLVGNVLNLAGRPVPHVILWWIGFPLLTIVGERLQLSRVLPAGRARSIGFLGAVVVYLLGPLMTLPRWNLSPGAAQVVAATGLLALALWLFRYDIARRTLREPGLRRFIGVCLLSGFGWLAFAGLLGLAGGRHDAGPLYDAFLHAFFLGFVFAMIFGHAPIIFPTITGRAVPFRRAFYAHVALLHASLALRVAGDLAAWWPGRRWGALLNAAALLLFPLLTVRAVLSDGKPAAVLVDRGPE